MTSTPVDLARQWTRELPGDFIRALIRALREGHEQVVALRSQTAGPMSRAACAAAIPFVQDGHGDYLSGLLEGMALLQAEQPSLTPVWTGPQSAYDSGRLTLAVVNDLIADARSEIVLASYAAYPSKSMKDALHRAANSGVEIILVLERPSDNNNFNGPDDPFPGLEARRLRWPSAARPAGASMHAKLMVVDRSIALVGSANLTNRAMEENLECGLLVRGGKMPERLATHLITIGPLVPASL